MEFRDIVTPVAIVNVVMQTVRPRFFCLELITSSSACIKNIEMPLSRTPLVFLLSIHLRVLRILALRPLVREFLYRRRLKLTFLIYLYPFTLVFNDLWSMTVVRPYLAMLSLVQAAMPLLQRETNVGKCSYKMVLLQQKVHVSLLDMLYNKCCEKTDFVGSLLTLFPTLGQSLTLWQIIRNSLVLDRTYDNQPFQRNLLKRRRYCKSTSWLKTTCLLNFLRWNDVKMFSVSPAKCASLYTLVPWGLNFISNFVKR